jgi:hypothetical protein
MDRITNNRNDGKPDPELARIRASLERLESRFDEFCRVYLDARFPFGKPVDRWRRGA